MLCLRVVEANRRREHNLIGGYAMDTLPQNTPTGKYYVYTLSYPKSMGGTVFYVGKGTGDRINQHEIEAQGKHYARNPYKINVIRKIQRSGQHIVKNKLAYFDIEQDAFMYEIALIFLLPHLTNATVGGEGASGYKCSEENIQKKREDGRRHYLEGKFKLLTYAGRKHSEATRAKIGLSNQGKKHAPKTRAKISAARTGQKRTHVESEATKQKRSETRRRNGWLSNPEATHNKWREQRLGKGRKHTPESLEKKRIATTGKTLSDETKQKIKETKAGSSMQPVKNVKEIRLNHWRMLRGLSQRELARMAKVATDTISEVENCKKIPRLGVLQKLAKALNITFDQLVIRFDGLEGI